MKRALLLLLAFGAGACAPAQRSLATGGAASLRASQGPVNVPGWPSVVAPASDDALPMMGVGQCQSVRPGDVVRFALRIESVEAAHAVFSQLQMETRGHHVRFREADLPLLREDVLAGGGVGTRDAAESSLYHFEFVVPPVSPGVYRVTGFAVQAPYGHSERSHVTLDRHAREQVNGYCLAVFGGSHEPVVTDFLPKPVERTAAAEPVLTLR